MRTNAAHQFLDDPSSQGLKWGTCCREAEGGNLCWSTTIECWRVDVLHAPRVPSGSAVGATFDLLCYPCRPRGAELVALHEVGPGNAWLRSLADFSVTLNALFSAVALAASSPDVNSPDYTAPATMHKISHFLSLVRPGRHHFPMMKPSFFTEPLVGSGLGYLVSSAVTSWLFANQVMNELIFFTHSYSPLVNLKWDSDEFLDSPTILLN